MKNNNFVRTILISYLLISGFSNAALASELNLKNLDHDLVLNSGPPTKCTSDTVLFLPSKKILVLGGNLSFSFEKTETQVQEKDQCQYDEELKISDTEFWLKTIRTRCPKTIENGVVYESVRLIKKINQAEIIYSNRFQNNSYECSYSLRPKEKSEKK